MSNFIEINVLHNVGPNASNCDDLGNPKTVSYGPKDTRNRFSSQSLTRAIKEAIIDRYENEVFVDFSSRKPYVILTDILVEKYKYDKEIAQEMARNAFNKFFSSAAKKAKSKTKDSKETERKDTKEVITLVSKQELEDIAQLLQQKMEETVNIDKTKLSAKVINDIIGSIDIKKFEYSAGLKASMFGRMFASKPTANTSATVQRSHAFTTHSVDATSNIDTFTAMDEVLSETTGAAHLGEKMFSCGCYYKCYIIDVQELMDDKHLGNIVSRNKDFDPYKLLENLIKECMLSLPNGKTNTFFNKTAPSCVLINVVKDALPLSCGGAFSNPIINDEKCTQNSFNALLLQNEVNAEFSNHVFTGLWHHPSLEVTNSYICQESISKLIDSVIVSTK